MKKDYVKRRISPVLRKMNVGDKESFPFIQYTSLLTTITRLQTELSVHFSLCKKDMEIEVTRTA